jgi:hypothetical protein
MILAKDFEMISQLVDSTGQQRDLDVSTPGVFLVKPESAQIDLVTRCHSF